MNENSGRECVRKVKETEHRLFQAKSFSSYASDVFSTVVI